MDDVFPAAFVNVREKSAAELLAQSELVFGKLPVVHGEVVQILSLGSFLREGGSTQRHNEIQIRLQQPCKPRMLSLFQNAF